MIVLDPHILKQQNWRLGWNHLRTGMSPKNQRARSRLDSEFRALTDPQVDMIFCHLVSYQRDVKILEINTRPAVWTEPMPSQRYHRGQMLICNERIAAKLLVCRHNFVAARRIDAGDSCKSERASEANPIVLREIHGANTRFIVGTVDDRANPMDRTRLHEQNVSASGTPMSGPACSMIYGQLFLFARSKSF